MYPGDEKPAGKRRFGKTRKSSEWLRIAPTELARAAARFHGTYLGSQYTDSEADVVPKKPLWRSGARSYEVALELLPQSA